MEKHYLHYKHSFNLESNASLAEIDICYHTSKGAVNNRKVIWICHALTANSDPSEWWGELVGEGKLFDTEKYFVVCANILSSCYGSTGPQSVNPQTSQPYLLDFPIISIRDMVEAHELLRKHLQIDEIEFLIGGSSGGFQAVEWAVSNPNCIKNLCLIACNARVSPWGTAFNESQRMALRTDANFLEQKSVDAGKIGLECARSIAILSYRSFEGYGYSQKEDDEDCFTAERSASYQRYQGLKLSKRFNPYSYYYLTFGVDSHNVGRNRGGVNNALSRIKANTICVSIGSDLLFPPCEIEAMSNAIPNSQIEYIDSIYGHDGFLLEYDQLIKIITKHFNI